MRKTTVLALAGLTFVLFSNPALAVPILPGQYYTDAAGGGVGTTPAGYTRNDDLFFGPYDLGFSLTFFGNPYTQFFLATNGNITFGTGVNAFTPTATLDQQTLAPMIAPYWADIDTRPANGGNVTLRTDPQQVIVTWDQVGYFSQHTDQLASLQLVVRGAGYAVPADEGQIGFFFKTVGWETGDASGGVGGFGGTQASSGFGDGLGSVNAGEVSIPGSRQAGISRVVTDQHYWFNLGSGGVPVPVPPDVTAVPEPASLLLLGSGLAAACARARKGSRKRIRE